MIPNNKISNASYLGFKDFLYCIFSKKRKVNPWQLSNSINYFLPSSTDSLNLIFKIRNFYSKKDMPMNILIPDYFCNMTIENLNTKNENLIFYKIKENFKPSIDSIKEICTKFKPDIFINVNYFNNFDNNIDDLSFLKDINCWLIQDEAHKPFPDNEFINKSDFTIFSPHKHLAINSGAYLCINKKGPNRIPLEEISKITNLLYKKENYKAILNASDIIHIIKSLLKSIGLRTNPNSLSIKKIKKPSKKSFSLISRYLLEKQINKIDYNQKKLEEIYKLWESLFELIIKKDEKSNTSLKYFYKLKYKKSLIPILKNIKLWKESELPIKRWPDLNNKISGNNDHLIANQLYENNLYLTINFSITRKSQLSSFNSLLDRITEKWVCQKISLQEYDEIFKNSSDVNLTQSPMYGEAKAKLKKQKITYLKILDENKKLVSISQLAIKKILFFSIANNSYGPIISANTNESMLIKKVLSIKCIIKYFNNRPFKFFFISPNIKENNSVNNLLESINLKKANLPQWKSGILDLKESEDNLFKNLKSKWRNTLRKAIKEKIDFNILELNRKNINLFLNDYIKHQKSNKYKGINKNLIFNILNEKKNKSYAKLYEASKNGKKLSSVLILYANNNAYYIIGTNNSEGKKCHANSFLIWQSIIDAKLNEMSYFDLGGIGDKTPAGIKKFKNGLNPKLYAYQGLYTSRLIANIINLFFK